MVAANYYFKFLILGTVFLATGLLINYGLPPLIASYIDTQIALWPSSQSYPLWKEPPVPIYQKFYFFNVTNAQDIEQRGHKPKLEEIGPFTYRTEWSKRDIESDDLRNVIQFKHYKEWHFVPEMSIADHKLQLVTLNAPLAITLTLIQSASNAVRLLVTFSLDGLSDGFFTKRSIKQLLFDGYPDLLTTFGPLLNAEMLSQGGHFGYMNARNGTLDASYEINTGADQINKLNTINAYNGQPQLPYWHKHGHCNSLEGASVGEMFPPIRDNLPEEEEGQGQEPAEEPGKANHIKLFNSDFCRVWRLEQASRYEHPSGLRVRRFKATRDVLRNSTDLPENSCFFSATQRRHSAASEANSQMRNPERQRGRQSAAAAADRQQQQHTANNRHNGNNNNNGHNRVRYEWPAGVFSLAPCKFNAPIYISMPHFLDADPFFNSHVDGLEPDPSRHEFYVDLEPRTGSPVEVRARVQLNVAISKPPGLVRFRNVPEIMFPVFWQELAVNVTQSQLVVDQLMLASRRAQEATTNIAYSFLLLGAVVLTTSALFIWRLDLSHLLPTVPTPLGATAKCS